MKPASSTSWPRRLVAAAAVGLFAAWVITHLHALTATQNGFLRFTLTAILTLLILFRPKPAAPRPAPPLWLIALAAAAATGAIAAGIVFEVRQWEWIGILLLLAACLRWGLPAAYGPEALPAMLLLYWAHPLPERLFTPLQVVMQHASVRGSEWFLHLFNVRVWADGLVLRTGVFAYEIPEWCSGMRTATTVLLLGLGLGVLRRFRWYETAVLTAAGLAQALILNVLRISAMVVFVPRTQGATGAEFLHDTTGVVVIMAALLLALETALIERWRQWRAQRADRIPGLTEALAGLPAFWRRLRSASGLIVALIAAAGVVAGLVYKSRPAHRINMIRDVAIALRDTRHMDDAERAAQLVLANNPEDPEWRLTLIRLLLLRGKNEEVIRELDTFQAKNDIEKTQHDILRAYALMGMKRLNETAAVVEQLPESVRRSNPRVAIILAEMAMHAGKADEAAEHVVLASRWPPNEGRVRAMFPYLRRNRKWQAIAAADSPSPHTDPLQAFAAMEAFMNLNRQDRVTDLTENAVRRWPRDPRLLEPLYFLALRDAEGTRSGRFAEHLLRCVESTQDADVLFRCFEKCFALARPDLAWMVYRRLEEQDPKHPALGMCAAKYGHLWFVFRKRFLGISAPVADETIDLRPYFLIGGDVTGWGATLARIPLGHELAAADPTPERKLRLAQALDEFAARDAGGRLSMDMQYEFVSGLEMANRVEESRTLLDRIAKLFPEKTESNLLFLSDIYERKRDWSNLYELLREYPQGARLQLSPMLRLCRAQMELRLGLGAIYTARETVRRFPGSGQASAALAEALARYDSHEESLQSLTVAISWRQREHEILEAEALWTTQRFGEADTVRRAALLPPFPDVPAPLQDLVPRPAELTMLWHRVSLPSKKEFEKNAAQLRDNIAFERCPFLRDLMKLWVDCHGAPPGSPFEQPERWAALGRDRFEKATALNQLTLLLCYKERFSEALRVAQAAVEQMPESPLLWRVLLSLSGADMNVVRRAREACPADSELWLAEVVASTQTNATQAVDGVATNAPILRDEEGMSAFLQQSFKQAEPGYSPVAMTRAGEYLYRIGMKRSAALAARDASSRARTYLPAYVLGVRCALQTSDKDWAMDSVKRAIDASLSPPKFFFQKLVQMKSSTQPIATDPDMINALRNLRESEPESPMWAEMLGYVAYKLGGVEMVQALFEMTAAIQGGSTNATPYVVAAEAARYIGNYDRAEDLLRQGLQHHPDDLVMLNNLTYVLGADKVSVGEALKTLPVLLQRAPDNPAIVDTVSLVHLTAGNYEECEAALQRLEKLAPARSPLWFRAKTRRAEMMVKRGKILEAKRYLTDLIKDGRGMPDEDVVIANSILSDVTERMIPPRRREQSPTDEFPEMPTNRPPGVDSSLPTPKSQLE